MTALDLSAYAAEVEPPELTEFKKLVIAEATKHSQNHHCGSIKEILRPLGLDKQVAKVTVKITTSLGFVFDVAIDPAELIGKTEAQQKTKLAETIGDIKLASQSATGSFVITGKTITTMELAPEPEVPDIAPDDPNWYFLSNEGRVKHYFSRPYSEQRGWEARDRCNTACGKSTYYPTNRVTNWRGGFCVSCTRSRAT